MENEYLEIIKNFSSLILAVTTISMVLIMYLTFKCLNKIYKCINILPEKLVRYYETKKLLKLTDNAEKLLKQQRDRQDTKKTWTPAKPKEWRKKYYGKKEDEKR